MMGIALSKSVLPSPPTELQFIPLPCVRFGGYRAPSMRLKIGAVPAGMFVYFEKNKSREPW